MASTGLLVVSNIKQLGKSLRSIEKYVNSLYIHLNVPAALATSITRQDIQPPPVWGRLISQLYADGHSYVGSKIDLRVLVTPLKQDVSKLRLRKSVDLIFSDAHQPELCDSLRTALNITKPTIFLQDANVVDLQEDTAHEPKMYSTVVLGGTFDRIHLGHKILLTQAVLRTRKRLVVGVTTAAMTKSKTLPYLILPVKERIAQLKEFLTDIDSTLQYDIVPIDDPFGPTQHDPDMDMIVVSAETLRGGQKVNELRAAKQLRELDIFVIDIVESLVSDGIHESKVSSSNTRIDLLGTRWQQPAPRPQLPARPYIIGLTGGIASGKSKMGERLGNMGAHVIDCDKVAHEVYEPGQPCYEKIVAHFGPHILDANGRIDRGKLGPIVFANTRELEMLNGIVWPALMAEVNRRLAALRSATAVPKVVVLEAAVLLRAGWETECHEVWSMIVPPEEAIKRVMERNCLSEEEARKRVANQIPNDEIVAQSHVIFSSQWDYDFTQRQAERAWQMLNTELDARQSSL